MNGRDRNETTNDLEFGMKKLLGYVLAIILSVTFLVSCGNKIEPGTTEKGEVSAVKAPVAVAELTQQPFLYEAVGTVTAQTASTISSKLMGVIQAVHVREGDLVNKGDLLVTIDQRQVTAHLARAQATAEGAAKEYKRYQKLLETQSASQQEFDRAEAQYRQAQASVSAALVSTKDAKVRAPYGGRVVAKMINSGDLASPGTPFLTLEQEGLYCTDLVLPERHIQSVQVGITVKVVVPAMNNRAFDGEVGRIVPMADARSRSFQIKVRMPEGPDYKSGMFARVSIPVGGTGMLLIPRSAIVAQGQLNGVFVVDEARIARFRLVRIGKTVGQQVEVVSGLTDGQRYVSAVSLDLKDGVKVKSDT
jgi:RND family efflux transporter MFP subunit